MAVIHLGKGIIQSAAEINYGGLRMIHQIVFNLATQVVLPLCHLQRAEQAGRGFHLFPLLGKVVVQGIADPLGFRVGKELREALGAHQPPEERDDQRLLDGVFLNVVLHRLNQPFFS